MAAVKGKGTKDSPWQLKTPPGTSEYEAYRDEAADPPALVVQVGKTQLQYQLRAIDDLHAMLKKHGDWMPLGSADEQKPAADGTVEAWGRSRAEPRQRLVRAEEGAARPLRDVRAAGAGGAWAWRRSSTTRRTTGCARNSASAAAWTTTECAGWKARAPRSTAWCCP